MKITKLYIKQFGKIKDYEIKFENGINIITGHNEAGKSTILAFIKAFLYGLPSKLRKKYKPWSGGNISGELHFVDDLGNHYEINRKFGDTQKTDETTIISNGKEVKHINYNTPGVDLLGVFEEAFERTLYINQLGSTVNSNDEIETKLANLHQSGDENISYRTTKEKLNDAKKAISNRRSGLLDNRRIELDQLKEEKNKLISIHDINISDKFALKQLTQEKFEKINLINELKHKKVILKKSQVLNDYLELEELRNLINRAEEEMTLMNKELIFDEIVIDEDYLNKLTDHYKEYHQELKNYDDIKNEKQQIELLICDKEIALKNYQGFNEFDDDIDITLATKTSELNNLQLCLNSNHKLKENILQLETERDLKLKQLEHLINFEKADETVDSNLITKSKKINELKEKLKDKGKLENLNFRQDVKTRELRNSTILLVSGIVLIIFSLIIGILVHPIFFTFMIVSLIMIIFSVFTSRKIKSELNLIHSQINELNKLKLVEVEKTTLETEVNKILSYFGVNSIEEYSSYKSRYNEKMAEVNVLNLRINQKYEELAIRPEADVLNELNITKNFIDNCLVSTFSQTIEEFKTKNAIYKRLVTEKTNLNSNLDSLNNKLSKQNVILNECETKLRHLLSLINHQLLDFSDFGQMIANLKTIVERKVEIENDLKLNQSLFKSKLKGRDFLKLKSEVEFTNINSSELSLTSDIDETTIESKINELTDEIKAIDDHITQINLRIEKSLYGTRDLDIVESELEACNNHISELEAKLESLNLSLEVLDEAFNDLQKAYGLELKKCVENIISNVTDGKYNELVITDEFKGMAIKDPLTGEYKDINNLSNGTLDLIYLCLRLGLTELLFKDKKHVPVFMDDSFVQYDDERVNKALDYLLDNIKNKQILLFTCHKREKEYLSGKDHVKVVNL